MNLRQHSAMMFFLGWCAGVLTLIVALLMANAEACGELPPPDETIKQIKTITV